MKDRPSPSRLAAILAAPLVLLATPARAQTAPPDPGTEERAAPPDPGTEARAAPPRVQIAPPDSGTEARAVPPRAQTVPPDRGTEERAASSWYGWQTLLAVAPFDIAMFVGLARTDDRYGTSVLTTGFVGRNLAPAVVHGAHRRVGLAFSSIALHAATTATGVAVGYAIGLALQGKCPPLAPCRNGFRDLPPGPGYGAVGGSMLGTLLDVVFLARRPRSTWERARTASTFTVVPFAAPTTLGLSAGGTF